MNNTTIGFVGQGFIGKHMADDFVERGHSVVRYALEPAYEMNRDSITDCDVVFIAVPTPTTPTGFDSSILEAVLPLVGVGKIAVIKSTILPGTTARLQAQFPNITLLHSPEFLREKSALEDTRAPVRTIVGLPVDDAIHRAAAELVIALLPTSPFTMIVTSAEAELIKYGGNNFLALKVMFMNILYDAAEAAGANYSVIAEAMKADPRIGTSHMNVIDQSGHPGSIPGRGAGGHCFPKDWAAFRAWYEMACGEDVLGVAALTALEEKNIELLRQSDKDLELLRGIYGK
ncbi:MAG: NAD(P)-binding domain-containing protein [Candidatus Pacebacteria bacterium]|jgi:UDPglucose 6-dehydrogenase|nr:NAD(P)-binding domain-containing protein [Candidatus Paceibacterota bacterium]